MDDILLLDTAERYLKGQLTQSEKSAFDKLRQDVPEVDQLVVEHSMFLHQIEAFGDNRNFKHLLHDVHNDLLESGEISEHSLATGGKILQFWVKYKRVTGIAAAIACITALVISSLMNYITPGPRRSEIVLLNRKLDQVINNVRVQNNKLNVVLGSKVPAHERALNGGSSFLIDGRGYLATNYHVVDGSSTILVQNNKGQQYHAQIVYLDKAKDLAILKIDDDDYKPLASLPYGIKKNAADLGEPIFTLGFPREEIVYNEGYMSAQTGFKGDTSTYQIAVSANPGNSGGPVFNKNGELVGILSTAQSSAEGVVFAINSKVVAQTIDNLRKSDTTYQNIRNLAASKLKGMDRVQQVQQIEDCVYMVKSFSK